MTLRRYDAAWAVLAALLGIGVALEPPTHSDAAVAVLALILCALITPYAAIIVLMVIAPLRTLIATEAPLDLPLDVGQISLIVLVCFWFAESLINRRTLPRIRWTPVYLPVIGFLAAASLSAFTAVSMSAWINEWLKWAQILLLIALVLDLARQGGRAWIIFGLCLAGASNAIIGIYEFFGGSGALHLLVDGNRFRAFGTFGQPNPFGGFMGLIAPLAIMAALGYASRLWRIWRKTARLALITLVQVAFYGAAFVLMAAGVYASYSRGAWLAFAASFAVIAFALPRKTWIGVALVGGGALLFVTLWSTGRLPTSIEDRLNSFTQETFASSDVRGVTITSANYAVIERLAHWQAAINMATVNPLLGVGFGGYEAAYPAYGLMNWDLALGHAHNYYLNVLAETGIIGLIFYLALWVVVVALTWNARLHPDQLARLTAVGLLGTWTYLAVHSLTDNLYVNNLFIHIGIMLGLLALLQSEVATRNQ